MADIITSTLVKVWPQVTGDADVLEEHADDLGNKFQRFWNANPPIDYNVSLASHALDLSKEIKQAEEDEVMKMIISGVNLVDITLKYITLNRIRTRILKTFMRNPAIENINLTDEIDAMNDAKVISLTEWTQTKVNKLRKRVLAVKEIAGLIVADNIDVEVE
jgi:hypothetical protein